MTDDDRLTYLRGLMGQFSNMLSEDAWEPGDASPTFASLAAFFNVLAETHAGRPGLGTGGEGDLLASWHGETYHIVAEFDMRGEVNWVAQCGGVFTLGDGQNSLCRILLERARKV